MTNITLPQTQQNIRSWTFANKEFHQLVMSLLGDPNEYKMRYYQALEEDPFNERN